MAVGRGIEINVNQDQLKQINRRLNPDSLFREIRREWNDEGNAFRNFMMNRHMKGGTTDDRLDTFGGLRNAFSVEVRETKRANERVRVRHGFTRDVKKYAYVHEYGARIRAKRSEYLHFKTKDGSWVQVKEVYIPPRLNLRKEFKAWEPKYVRSAKKAVDRSLSRG